MFSLVIGFVNEAEDYELLGLLPFSDYKKMLKIRPLKFALKE